MFIESEMGNQKGCKLSVEFDGKESPVIGTVVRMRYPGAARLSTLNILLEVSDDTDSEGREVLRVRIGEDRANARPVEIIARYSETDGLSVDQVESKVA